MFRPPPRSFSRAISLLAALFILALAARAGVGGRISGTVKDATGAVIPKSSVSITNAETGVRQVLITDDNGAFSFLNVQVGRYNLEVSATGFRPYQRTGIALDANSTLTIDAVLEVGGRSDAVTVVDNQLHVDTTSTQIGEVITDTQMTAVPLNGRSYTDLLALQPGVVPVTSITNETVQDVGASALSPSGDLNPGTISINGQREFANAFIVNGSDVEEDVNMGAAVIPNLDSIAEFRILTSNFDAEYGEFSGGQINVVTKSGVNAFHGDLFEFLRNTNFDARNYFSPTRGKFDKNQFGGTFGGPIRKNQIFFFGDYQGTRSTEGVDSGEIPIPSNAQRSGNFIDPNSGLNTLTGSVGGSYFASLLASELGYPVSSGEPYAQVFPNGVIPKVAWSAPAQNLLQYIPAANVGTNDFATSAQNLTLRDDKGAYRVDANSRWGQWSAYYFLDDWAQNNPYPIAQ